MNACRPSRARHRGPSDGNPTGPVSRVLGCPKAKAAAYVRVAAKLVCHTTLAAWSVRPKNLSISRGATRTPELRSSCRLSAMLYAITLRQNNVRPRGEGSSTGRRGAAAPPPASRRRVVTAPSVIARRRWPSSAPCSRAPAGMVGTSPPWRARKAPVGGRGGPSSLASRAARALAAQVAMSGSFDEQFLAGHGFAAARVLGFWPT